MADPNIRQRSESFQWMVPVTGVLLYILYLFDRWPEMIILISSLAFYFYLKQLRAEKTSSENILVKQLLEMGVGREAALEAAEACSSIESAKSFLNQKCDKCLQKLSKQKMLSMLRCSHQICKPCAQKFFTQVLKEGHINKCVCPICHCPNLIDDDLEYFSHLGIILNEILDLEHLQKFNRMLEESPEKASGKVKIEETLVHHAKKLSRECGLCCEMWDVDEMESLFFCEHMCCKTCIKKYFEVLLREKSINNCSCPFCNKPDLTSDKEHAEEFFKTLGILLQRILDPPMYDMYLQKVLDRTLNNNPCFKWCSKCSTGFDINAGQKRVTCNECGFVQCSSCKCEWENTHDRMTCEEFSNWKKEEKNTQKLEKYLETAEKVICPACKFVFLLDRGGCLHFVCSQCKHEFCSGCQQQFFHKSCDKNCVGKGLHAHHPRNCLYFLRDYPPSQLQQILTNNKIHFYTERNGQTENCAINVRNETPDGLVDASCGVEAPQGFAGLCKNHYVEYLCKVIWDAKVDVSPLAEISNAELPPEATKTVPLSQADNTSEEKLNCKMSSDDSHSSKVQAEKIVLSHGVTTICNLNDDASDSSAENVSMHCNKFSQNWGSDIWIGNLDIAEINSGSSSEDLSDTEYNSFGRSNLPSFGKQPRATNPLLLVQQQIGFKRRWPHFIKNIIWEQRLNNKNRLAIATFFYLNGCSIELLIDLLKFVRKRVHPFAEQGIRDLWEYWDHAEKGYFRREKYFSFDLDHKIYCDLNGDPWAF